MLAASLTREPRADDAAIRRMCGGETSVKAVVEAVVQRVLEAMQDEKLFTARDAVRDLEFTLAQAVMTTPQLDEGTKDKGISWCRCKAAAGMRACIRMVCSNGNTRQEGATDARFDLQ